MTAQPLVIDQAGSAQLMVIYLSASFPGLTSVHETNQWLKAVAELADYQMCIDYIPLNTHTKRMNWSSPGYRRLSAMS
jgi:hypothetical protein